METTSDNSSSPGQGGCAKAEKKQENHKSGRSTDFFMFEIGDLWIRYSAQRQRIGEDDNFQSFAKRISPF
jgi:hypothetical protein